MVYLRMNLGMWGPMSDHMDDFSSELDSGLRPVEGDAGRFSAEARADLQQQLTELEAVRLRAEAESHRLYIGA